MQSSPLPDPLVVQIARQNREAILAMEDEQTVRMLRWWTEIERSVADDLRILAQDILDAKEKGKLVNEQLIARQARYLQLQEKLKQQILALTKNQVSTDIEQQQLAYALHGIEGAQMAIRSQASMGIVFNLLSVDQIQDLAGQLGDGTPLYRLLQEAYPESIDGIIKALLEGAAKGLNSRQIAQMMADKMGLGLSRILLIARTEQLRAWRLSTWRQYQQSGVVLYHQRLSARDARTCMACLMADGEIIPITQPLEDHPRGRCTSIPVVRGAPPIVREYGQEWFLRQSPETQKSMMGPGMYDLWKQKNFDLTLLHQVHTHPVWGTSPRVPALKEMAALIKT